MSDKPRYLIGMIWIGTMVALCTAVAIGIVFARHVNHIALPVAPLAIALFILSLFEMRWIARRRDTIGKPLIEEYGESRDVRLLLGPTVLFLASLALLVVSVAGLAR